MAMVEEMLDPKTTNSRAKMPNVATKMATTNHQNPEEISEDGQHGQPLSPLSPPSIRQCGLAGGRTNAPPAPKAWQTGKLNSFLDTT